MTTVSALLARGRQRLQDPVAARLLLCHVLGVDAKELLLVNEISADDEVRYEAVLDERLRGTPVQHLTGFAPFRTVSVAVGPGVFIPRPETEVLTGWALDVLATHKGVEPPIVVELCAGSGAITKALVAEGPPARYYAVELSDEAWPWLERNVGHTDVHLVFGDMADALPELNGQVDLVVANPPYIPLQAWEGVPTEVRDYDPHMALFSGDDGLDAMRIVAEVAERLLRPGGWVGVEHAEVQHHSAPDIFMRRGTFDRIDDRHDLTMRPRYVVARRATGRMEL